MDRDRRSINLALSVGIYPYTLKLLQSPSKELREVLVFIWAKILSDRHSAHMDAEYLSHYTCAC